MTPFKLKRLRVRNCVYQKVVRQFDTTLLTRFPVPLIIVCEANTSESSQQEPIKDNTKSSEEPSMSTSIGHIVDTDLLPDIGSLRAKFEKKARNSETNIFEFGEAFRQKQRDTNLAVREKTREAVTAMRGFDEMMFSPTKSACGEVDRSNIATAFVFEGASADFVALNDGTCKVDYENCIYRSQIFVVHRTKGKNVLTSRLQIKAIRNLNGYNASYHCFQVCCC